MNMKDQKSDRIDAYLCTICTFWNLYKKKCQWDKGELSKQCERFRYYGASIELDTPCPECARKGVESHVVQDCFGFYCIDSACVFEQVNYELFPKKFKYNIFSPKCYSFLGGVQWAVENKSGFIAAYKEKREEAVRMCEELNKGS